MPADTYTSVPSTGKLKLKGVSDGRIDKKKKKKKEKRAVEEAEGGSSALTSGSACASRDHDTEERFKDNSVVLKTLENEDDTQDQTRRKPDQEEHMLLPSHAESPTTTADKPTNTDVDIEDMNKHLKTPSELRFEEQRRKRLEEKLKRDGVKTHKQRVEELNRYLSGLSEHHDMPKIGPG